MRIKKMLPCLMMLCVLQGFSLYSQSYPRGAILDDGVYDSLPRKAVQLQRSYTALPQVHSLKQYTPYPGNQGQYGTCVGWSSAYAARTIAESIALNRLDRFLTTSNAFSPIFVYKSIFAFKNLPPPTGHEGAAISWALDFMYNQGPVKRLDFEKTADFSMISLAAFSNSPRYPIGGYSTLYASSRGASKVIERSQAVKRSIAAGKPVIFGMNCPDSFFSAKGVWRPAENPETPYGGHAMCVVGYDDTRYGGAFEIQNSWGDAWGNGGYMWIPYQVFNQFASHAYELIDNLAAYKNGTEYEGFAQIEVYASKQGMPVRFSNGYYRTTGSYPSGTMFRYLLGNNKPAYVYAFAGDSGSQETTRIFPPQEGNVSPVLDYEENTIAFPGEYAWIQLDQKPGTDYLVVLYAKEALDIEAIRNRFAQGGGTFPERVARAVGEHYMPSRQTRYDPAEMRFTAQSGNPKAVFGLLLAIDHK